MECNDIAFETARLTHESDEHNAIYRQILDLTYQISNDDTTAVEDTDTAEIPGLLAAHTGRDNWVNAKYLPSYLYVGESTDNVTNIFG